MLGVDPGGVSRDGSCTDELPETTESLELSGRAWRSEAASGEATDGSVLPLFFLSLRLLEGLLPSFKDEAAAAAAEAAAASLARWVATSKGFRSDS